MGNGFGKVAVCFSGGARGRRMRRHDMVAVLSEPLDEGLGHSFCYVRRLASSSSSKVHHSDESSATAPAAAANTAFRSISGASVSANTSTQLSTSVLDLSAPSAAAFESSNSFASIPLRLHSGPLDRSAFLSGPIDRSSAAAATFLSGPIDRVGFMSGPLDPTRPDPFELHRSLSHGAAFSSLRPKPRRASALLRALRRAFAFSVLLPSAKDPDSGHLPENLAPSSTDLSLVDDDSSASMESQNLQWAQGKAGEDRVHVVVSEEHGWVFVGIYDGFNGPDAPDFLLSNLYSAVHKELKGLLWEDKFDPNPTPNPNSNDHDEMDPIQIQSDPALAAAPTTNRAYDLEEYAVERDRNLYTGPKGSRRNSKSRLKGAAKKREENQRRWKCEWERERLELERKVQEQLSRVGSEGSVNHSDVLKALSRALKKIEEDYLDIADKLVAENPELALMGSCVLVMLMKGDDVYLMNVGDSRAVLAHNAEPDIWGSLGKAHQDLERINEETPHDLEASNVDRRNELPNLTAIQLTVDHSTSVEEEVRRIKSEHPDDDCAVVTDRVKGSLKVTRAFGAGFLKQPKWNDALLEMFRIDYVGASPYITCTPSLFHYQLGPRDRFLILSSDGLYQYFTNEEAVAQVEMFITSSPDGDPAQHLIEEVLFRAAKKAGMDFQELLEIPQGDRRRYHDDISIIVISLEGRIWRSCV